MSTSSNGIKRKKVKYIKPNELFVKWLEEWYTETATKGSKLQYAFGKALVSLKRYPLPLKSGKECLVLEHFGPSICVKLDRRLAEYKIEHPEQFSEQDRSICDKIDEDTYVKKPKASTSKNIASSCDVIDIDLNKSPRKCGYMPSKNSPAYAILVGMHENGLECSIDETQLQIVVKRILNKPYPTSAIDNLIKKGFITENQNSDIFRLTDAGRKLAEVVYSKYILSKVRPDKNKPKEKPINSYNRTISDIIPLGSSESELIVLDDDCINIDSQSSSQKSESQSSGANSQSTRSYKTNSQLDSQASNGETVCMLPNTFEIILIVDNHETGARFTVQTETAEELTRLGVKYDVRGLKIGDFTWIARDEYGNELVLPYIVERKRMDDFAQSIKDSRYQEQKFRLKNCGLKNLIYLVENYGSNMFLGLPLTSVLQAATNLEIIDKFTVKFTDNHADSMKYLQQMSVFLSDIYSSKTLMSTFEKTEISQTFDNDVINLFKYKMFNSLSVKIRNYTVKEMFTKQLLQLSGLSLAKANVIVDNYPTPVLLINAFHEHGPELLANLTYTQIGTRIGSVISNSLYQLYTRDHFT